MRSCSAAAKTSSRPSTAIEAEVSRSAVFISYGVTNRLDVSIALPIVTADLVVTSDATIQRIGTTNPETHFFRSIEDDIGARRRFTAFGHASGLGDVTVRLKQTVRKAREPGRGTRRRSASADRRRAQSAWHGRAGRQPVRRVVGKLRAALASPERRVSVERRQHPRRRTRERRIGGSSRSGDVFGGAVIEVHPRMTAAVDVIGRYIIDSPRLRLEDFHALDGQSVFPNITFTSGSFNEISAAAGLKVNVLGRLLAGSESPGSSELGRSARQDLAARRRRVRVLDCRCSVRLARRTG